SSSAPVSQTPDAVAPKCRRERLTDWRLANQYPSQELMTDPRSVQASKVDDSWRLVHNFGALGKSAPAAGIRSRPTPCAVCCTAPPIDATRASDKEHCKEWCRNYQMNQ